MAGSRRVLGDCISQQVQESVGARLPKMVGGYFTDKQDYLGKKPNRVFCRPLKGKFSSRSLDNVPAGEHNSESE